MTLRNGAHEASDDVFNAHARWRVYRVADLFQPLSLPGLAASDHLDDWGTWHRANGLLPGTPYLISPKFEFDVVLNAFFSSTDMMISAMSTQVGYAGDVKAFLNFLENSRGQSDWRLATEDDHGAYLIWRRRDPAGPRVAASTWDREVSGVDRFYRWQRTHGHIASSPIPHRARRTYSRSGHPSSSGDVAATYSHSARREQIRWLPPRSYRLWRDVGLRGYLAHEVPDSHFRGRYAERNAIFADLMVRTGLRLTEQCSLTLAELPEMIGSRGFQRFWLPASVAKGGSARWIYIPATILRDLHNYVGIDRRVAIQQAQARGLYANPDEYAWLLGDKHIATSQHGMVEAKLSHLTPAERARLLVWGRNGWEPASLWVSEAGTPMAVPTWKDIFRQANERCERHGVVERAHPHMLRHTFSVVTLEQLQRGHIAAMTDAAPSQRTQYARIFGDPLDWLRRRLGHLSVTTTQIYLHALEELEMETRMALVPDTWDNPPDAKLLKNLDTVPDSQ